MLAGQQRREDYAGSDQPDAGRWRPKDHNRILQFIEQGAIDRKKLQTIVERHNLNGKWQLFERRFLEGTHG
jgi:hypothetical protein